ncbi:50S ribosomal protein L17 [Zhouia spongiae]|uniref:Large ribosomal subunit protein bL17 n=1 Tax=Zhouia spongiae TaxID=2202721 RepID=A0ABY3YSS2_9FLAO|nr:50S ribosomal protein L17 [Zhouia spongiae]UNZ00432.1 50S ribosomal protein L17 [Zhouia spongiae]
MRHGKKFNHLGRKTAHRKAMFANMASSLIEHKRINTTLAKAKALKVFIEPLVTKAKPSNNTETDKRNHNMRVAFSYLRDKQAVNELFKEVGVKVGDRPGGYTRIIKLGNRLGDNADMAMIEFVDFNETYTTEKATKKKSTRRGRSKKVSAEVEEAPNQENTDTKETSQE